MAAERTQDAKAVGKISVILGELELDERRAIIGFLDGACSVPLAKAASRVAVVLDGLDSGGRERVLRFFADHLKPTPASE